MQAPKTIHVEPGSELDRALSDSGDEPIELVQRGVRYRVMRIGDSPTHGDITVADERDVWAGYEPERVQQQLRASRNMLRGVDRDQLLHDLSSERSQCSSGRRE